MDNETELLKKVRSFFMYEMEETAHTTFKEIGGWLWQKRWYISNVAEVCR